MAVEKMDDSNESTHDNQQTLPMGASTEPEEASDTLQSNDVIELQAFLERKSWIDAQIHLLEYLAPIDPFMGVDSLAISSKPVTGLPLRDEVSKWIHDIDRIAAETERFDQGEMNRLKEFAKAKSQQNLSPEDTDLIEVTLTTLLSLEKLTHLIRARSEDLDTLSLRLDWEQQRLAAWEMRDQVLDHLEAFIRISTWSTTMYDGGLVADDILGDTQAPRTPEYIFPNILSMSARAGRRKTSEDIAAALQDFVSRLHSFRMDTFPLPGATLDRMIDTSSKKIPDVLLDEQDKLENESKPLDSIDRFIPALQSQWRKADEYYAELKKDFAMAEIILEEITCAKNGAPSSALADSFSSRSSALSSRLSAIGHPSTVIPRPRHPLSPNQPSSNESIHSIFANELASTLKLVRLAQLRAKEYAALANATDRAHALFAQVNSLSSKLEGLEVRLRQGSDISGDGSPPDLSDPRCLEPTRHGAYIALLPSIFADIKDSDVAASQATTSLRAVLLELRPRAPMQGFINDADTALETLSERLGAVSVCKRKAVTDVDALRRSRAIWAQCTDLKPRIATIKEEIMEAIELQQWKPTLSRDGLPLTPDSPRSLQLEGNTHTNTPVILVAGNVQARIEDIQKTLVGEVQKPLSDVAPSLGQALTLYLESSVRDITSHLDSLRMLVGVLDRVQNQAECMRNVVSESYELDAKMDSLRAKIQETIDETLHGTSWVEGSSKEESLSSEVKDLRHQITQFSDALASRIPLVSSIPASGTFPPSADSRFVQHDTLQRKITTLDQAVRSDANNVALSLAGRTEALRRKLDLYSLVELARLLDDQLSAASQAIQSASAELSSLSANAEQLVLSLNDADDDGFVPDLEGGFARVLSALEALSSERTSAISNACTMTLTTLRQMRSSRGARDSSVHDDVLNQRSRNFEDVEAQAHAFQQEMGSLRAKVIEGRRLAENRLHKDRLRREREEMMRRGSITQAELEASRQALKESEAKALAALEERRRLEEEQARREEEARRNAQDRLEEQARDAAEREAEEKRLHQDEVQRQEATRRADEEALHAHEKERQLEEERRAIEAAEKEASEAVRIAEAVAAAVAAVQARDPDVFNATETPPPDAELAVLLSQISECRADLRSIGIVLAAKPEFESVEDAVSPLPSIADAHGMRSRFEVIVERVASVVNQSKDEKAAEELRSLKIELEASRVLLGHVDHLATFANKVELCDAALSDLLEHSDTYPDQPQESSSAHKPDLSKSAVQQLQDRLDFCELEVEALRNAFVFIGEDQRALGEKTRIMDMWGDVADSARHKIASVQASSMRPSSAGSRSLLPTSQGMRPPVARRSAAKEISPDLPSTSAAGLRLRTQSSTSSMKKPFIPSDPAKPRLRPTRDRSPSKSSNRSVSGPPTGSSRASERSKFKIPAVPSRPHSRASSRSVSGPVVATPSPALYSTPTSSRQRTTSTISYSRAKLALPVQRTGPTSGRSRKQTNSTPSITRASSPTLSTISNTSSDSDDGPHTPAPRPRPSAVRVRKESMPRRSVSSMSLTTPRPKPARPKKEYVANPKNKLDVAVGAVVNKLPADVTIEPVLDTWKDESGQYWIGDAEPKLCFCRILRSQTVMVRVGGGWMELSKFIRLHYSHLFRVDTLITPPKAPVQPGQERWISSTTLLEEGEIGSSNGNLSPVNVLRTPMIPATPDHASGHRRSPTPLFLRENSPGASSPLTPLHFIRRASVEPGGGLAPGTPSIREKSPGLSSDGGGSASGKRPRLSANATPVRRTQQLQTQGTPGGRRPWR